MLSPLVLSFIESAVLPALAVALLAALVGGRKDPLRARLQALFIALGFTAGSFVLFERMAFPPHDVNDSFAWAALLLMVFVWISPRPVATRYLVRAAFVVALGYLSLWPIHGSLTGHVHSRNLLAFFFLALGSWSIVEKSAQKVQLLTLIVLPVIAATALSFMLLFKGSASLSQLVSIQCSLLGGLAAVTWLWPKRVAAAAILPFVSVFIIAIMASGHFYLDINPWHMIYLCLPFLLLWIRGWIPFVPRTPLGESLVLGTIAAIPLGYFMWRVYQASGPLF